MCGAQVAPSLARLTSTFGRTMAPKSSDIRFASWSLLVGALVAAVTACGRDNGIMTPSELRERVAADLHVGDPQQKIEAFYARYQMHPLLQRSLHRYQAPFPLPKDFDHTLEVDIYVDDQGRFVRAEIADVFTAL